MHDPPHRVAIIVNRVSINCLSGGDGMYNILVCDDKKDIVAALRIYLEAEHYKVFKAYDG